jgi:hypothetical protein
MPETGTVSAVKAPNYALLARQYITAKSLRLPAKAVPAQFL